MAVRHRDQRVVVRACARNQELAECRLELGDRDDGRNEHSRAGAPRDHGEREPDREPDEAIVACVRQPDEQPVERSDAVGDDPVLDVMVEQALLDG